MFALFLSLVATLSDGCPHCEYSGMVPCKQHDADLHAQEEQVLFCSYAAQCERCEGTLLEDCQGCSGGPLQNKQPTRKKAIGDWLLPNALERHLERSLPRVETEHFTLVVETEPLKDGRKRIDPHALAHRLAADAEHVAAKVAEHFAVQPGDYSAKMRIWIFKDPDEHQKAMVRFLRSSGTGDFKTLGPQPVFSVWTERPTFDNVPKLRAVCAHNAGHMLVSNLQRPIWVGDIGGGWIDAAVGHWYEYELLERTLNYCVEEARLAEGYARGQWRSAIKKRLRKEEEPCLPRLLPQRTTEMAHSEHALAWSFFDFLVAEKPAALRPILLDLKNRVPSRDVFKNHLDGSVLQIEEAWRDWVAATYPSRGDRPLEGKQR